ncbi:MAG: cobalt ECF transporter T component CbiQ [Corynebacteriales bacterium]|nr:cobalt ECF transporter T component CbiQ [Mycobacteriales bacterium]
MNMRQRLIELPPQCKLAALITFVCALVATPAVQAWALLGQGLLLVCTALILGVSMRTMGRGLRIEAPFLLLAALLPFLADGPTHTVGPFELSESGLQGAWSIVVKAALGACAAVIVAATTPAPALISGAYRLGLPQLMVEIAAFMVRYGVVLREESTRAAHARAARGFGSTKLGFLDRLRVWARAAAALFVRAFERGERVYVAMLARGYRGGRTSFTPPRSGTVQDWSIAFAVPMLAIACALGALVRNQ